MTVQLYNVWILTAAFFAISTGLILVFPKYNVRQFLHTPRIKHITIVNYISYYGFFVAGIFIAFSKEKTALIIGLTLFLSGILLYVLSVFSFAVKEYNRPVFSRMYKYSRHPVYVSFIILSTGIAIVSFSLILFAIVILYAISSYFIMKKEEEICIEKYGETYIQYMKNTRMIL